MVMLAAFFKFIQETELMFEKLLSFGEFVQLNLENFARFPRLIRLKIV